MGRFWIDGSQANEFLNWIHSNDVANMKYGKAKYGLICNEQGGIIDDAIVYRLSETRHLLVANAANADAIHQWLISWQEKRYKNVSITPAAELPGMIAFQGPNALNTLSELLTSSQIAEMRPFSLIVENFQAQDIYVARTGYTGEDGVELMLGNAAAVSLWNTLIDLGVTPCGLGSRDTLRLEMNYALYGMDISKSTNPIEAGLGWITKFNKGDFIGRDALLIEKNKIHRSRISFEMLDRAVPRHNYNIIVDGNVVGKVTSGTQSPSLNKGIGIGYIQIEHSSPGTEIYIEIRSTLKPGVIINPPFYKKGTVNIIY